jgi:hypothetical protein
MFVTNLVLVLDNTGIVDGRENDLYSPKVIRVTALLFQAQMYDFSSQSQKMVPM